MGRQGLGGAGAAGRSMQRSQSRSSLSASFEALAGYFPCMNSLEEDEGASALAYGLEDRVLRNQGERRQEL